MGCSPITRNIERVGDDRLALTSSHPAVTNVPITFRRQRAAAEGYPKSVAGAKDSSGD
jgi:hypothetical protein